MNRFIKRSIDIFFSLFIILILLPIWIIILVAIKVIHKDHIFFTQTRIGLNTTRFKLYKFRSMTIDAPSTGSHSTQSNDPRITRLGKFLRKTSLDELPQLFNVLKGDMSLVGPRPDVPQQESNYTPVNWKHRHTVKPGITGLAQVTLRSQATHEQRLQLDFDYINRQSTPLDLWIMLQTLTQLTNIKKAN